MAEPEYTPEQANEMLPDLTQSLLRIREARQVVLSGGERIREVASLDGGGRQGKEYWEALSTLRREVEALNEKGIVLRDPETGLIDFPATREGDDVFLCWRLGEDRVGFWHGPDSGFAGRRPL
jgi:hypothetical protein